MSERFNERFSTLGTHFLIYGILSFFGFNNYAPYSLFYIRNEISFFQPKLIWPILVMFTHLLFIIMIIRIRTISKERDDEGFSKFSQLYLISGFVIMLAVGLVFAYSFFPFDYLYDFKFTAWIGIAYSVLLSIGFTIQIIAYIQVYNYSNKGETEVAKTLNKYFGKGPIYLVIGNSIAIISYVLSIIGGAFIIEQPIPSPPIFEVFDFALWAILIQIGWVVINTIVYVTIGSNIINKSSSTTKKTIAGTKQIKIKKARQSCPVCRNTIYEGSNTCTNCGYRII